MLKMFFCGIVFLLVIFSNTVFVEPKNPVAGGFMDLSNYKVTWDQDFTKLTELSVSDYGPCGEGGTTWMAHTPSGGDWCNFQNPSGPFQPFYLGNGNLTIRSQYENNNYYAGLLASVDSKGRGFSQQFGYFEMKAKLPGGLGTWPAFWLLDVPGLVNRSTENALEIDILEEYGNYKGRLHTTLHFWANLKNATDWGFGEQTSQCSMVGGYHTYGLDIQEDFLTFYFDRRRIWQYPNSIPDRTENFSRPFYVIVNLAYGGGGDTNNKTNLIGHPQDMNIEYVRVWQGSGGSKNSGTANWNGATFLTSGLVMNNSDALPIDGVTLTYTDDGIMTVTKNSDGSALWKSDTPAPNGCKMGCTANFQNDGNWVFNEDGKAYWGSSTWGNNEGSLAFSNTAPYLQIFDSNCNSLWKVPNN